MPPARKKAHRTHEIIGLNSRTWSFSHSAINCAKSPEVETREIDGLLDWVRAIFTPQESFMPPG